ARSGPLAERRNLHVSQSILAEEPAMPGLGQPGRHVAARGHLGDLTRALLRLDVAEQRKRTGAARMVARRAVFEKDWRDVTCKRWCVLRRAGTGPAVPAPARDHAGDNRGQ